MSIFFAQPIFHGGYRLHLAPAPARRWPPHPRGLFIGTFYIHDGRGFEITQAIRVVHIGGLETMVMTETKVADQYYFNNRLGYNVL